MIDAPIIHKELGCNPAMLRYTGWNPYRTLESTMDFLSHTLDSEKDNSWIIEVDGNVVGTIGAYNYCAEDASIEIGYSIFQKHWNKGYASQAVRLACKNLDSDENINTIKAWCANSNIASARVLENNGFTRKEIIESAINAEGEIYDQVIYEKRR